MVRTTWFVWCTTWLVPGNPFAPLGLNSNKDVPSVRYHLPIDPSHTVHLQGPPKAILHLCTAWFAISSENTGCDPALWMSSCMRCRGYEALTRRKNVVPGGVCNAVGLRPSLLDAVPYVMLRV